MRAHEKEPTQKVFGEPEIVELGLDDDGNRQWYMATREGWEEVGESGVLSLMAHHFAVGARITLQDPIPHDRWMNPHHSDTNGEDLSHDFEGHDCGEDICVCANPSKE